MNRRVENIVADLQKYLEQTRESGLDRVYLDAKRLLEARERFVAEAQGLTAGGVAKAPAHAGAPTKADVPPPVVDTPAPAAATKTSDAGAVGSEPVGPPVVVRDDARQAETAAALKAFDEGEVKDCTRCGLHSTRTQTVFGVGNPDADLVFVGEAPGRDEDAQGIPFVGAAGQLLTKILGAIGFAREDVYICNVLKCRPPNNRDPQPMEVASCEPYLLKQLDILQPKLICALGRHAAHTLLGTSDSLKRMRESVHDYHGIPTMVTYHPAALLRNPQWKRPTWEDVQKLRALYDQLVAGS
jgi:DNA polymerase